jgi:hypothetical protein
MKQRSQDERQPKEFATRVEAESWRLRGISVITLLWAYGFVIIATFTIFFLQGFQLGGFHLPDKVLLWLGGATVGEIAGLLMMSIRVVAEKNPLQTNSKSVKRKKANAADAADQSSD